MIPPASVGEYGEERKPSAVSGAGRSRLVVCGWVIAVIVGLTVADLASYHLHLYMSAPIAPHKPEPALPTGFRHAATVVSNGQRRVDQVKPFTVATVVTGDVRAWPRLVDNFLDVFVNHVCAGQSTVDVFLYLKMGREPSRYTVQQFGEALEKLRPRISHFGTRESDSAFDTLIPKPIGCEFPLNPVHPDYPGARLAKSFYTQFIEVYREYLEVQRQEVEQGWRYEWVCRHRADMRWEAVPVDFVLKNAARGRIHLNDYRKYHDKFAHSDHFACMTREVADLYMRMAVDMFDGRWCHPREFFRDSCHDLNENGPDHPQECYLARWLRHVGAQVEPHDLRFWIERDAVT